MRTGISEMSDTLMIPKFCFDTLHATVLCPEQLQLSRHFDTQMMSVDSIIVNSLKQEFSINANNEVLDFLTSTLCRNIDMFAIRRMVMRVKRVDGLDKLDRVGCVEMFLITSMDTDAQCPERMSSNHNSD